MPKEITLFHNPRCSKSRAVLQLLQQSGINFDVIDYQKEPPDAATIQSILQLLDISAKELIRRGEAQYKKLQSEVETYSEAEIISLMVQHPILIERPIVVTEDNAAIGRPIDNVIALLDQASLR